MSKLQTRKSSEEEGEAWLASYADLMTLLLCFFILLFAMSDRDPGKLESIAQAISSTFKGVAKPEKGEIVSKVGINHQTKEIRALHMVISLLGMGETSEAIKKIENTYIKEKTDQTIKNVIKKDLLGAGSGLKFQESDSQDISMSLNIPNEVFFGTGDADLNQDSKKLISKIASSIIKIQDIASIQVIGHTDSMPLSKSSPYFDNLGLSAIRASRVAKELTKYGLKDELIEVSGKGSQNQLFEENVNGTISLENMKKNRRIEIRIKRNIKKEIP